MDTQLWQHYKPSANALAGKTLLITGAASGLGRALATSCAEIGADLVLLDKTTRGLNALHDEIEAKSGRQPGLYPLDLAGANPDDYDELATVISREFGSLHGLLHCAARLGQLSPMTSADTVEWLQTFQVNLHGPLLLTQSVLPAMQITGGRIIFVTDTREKAYWGAYGVSKSALVSAARILADELDSKQTASPPTPLPKLVSCNIIDPGPMRTSLRTSAFPGEDPFKIPLPQSKVAPFLHLLCEPPNLNGELLTLAR